MKSATVSAMRPTASSLLLKCRWSTAPRRHSQPETVASGVMNRKHTMSPKRVRFSCWGPGFLSHCRQSTDKAKQVSASRVCLLQLQSSYSCYYFLSYFKIYVCIYKAASNTSKAIFNLPSDTCMQAEVNAYRVTFIKRILILQNRVPESQCLK